jgi:CubicO group peptidase (beta-lactamase class C family)
MSPRTFLAAPFAVLLLAAAPASAPAPASRLLSDAMQNRTVPAMALVIIRNGRVVDEAVAGVRAAGWHDRVRPGDLWHIGSDAKAMTAVMIARLVERGRLSWDAPLEKMLPELAKDMDPGYRQATLRELLSHRAGLHDEIDSDVYAALYNDHRPMHQQRLDYVRMALKSPPAYPPGSRAQYSNRGAIVAALIAEDVTGLSYETLMRREVFEPLGMTSATFAPTRPGDLVGHEKGKPQIGLHADNPPVDAPAGEVRLSLSDWARFAIDQIKGERGQGRLLSAATYRDLHTGEGGTIYALGWGAHPDLNGVQGRFLTHGGSNGYWLARIVLEPDTGDGFLIAANSADGGADVAEAEIEKALTPTLIHAR